jgi:hypothetical protein
LAKWQKLALSKNHYWLLKSNGGFRKELAGLLRTISWDLFLFLHERAESHCGL